MRACEFIRALTRLALVSCLTGCSFTEKQAQLSPLAGAEHRLAGAEKIRSDPSEKAAEILSVARTALSEISKKSGEANLEPPVRIYNRAATDLASELPELTQNRVPPQAITVQSRQTGETYRLRPGSTVSGEYSAAFFQELLDRGQRSFTPARAFFSSAQATPALQSVLFDRISFDDRRRGNLQRRLALG